jgi:hypothetical protein
MGGDGVAEEGQQARLARAHNLSTMSSAPVAEVTTALAAATMIQARFRGRRMRRARQAADVEMLYHVRAQQAQDEKHWARRCFARSTQRLTAGIAPYVTIRHALYSTELDHARGVRTKRPKSSQEIGMTHSCYISDSMRAADFTLRHGKRLTELPQNAFTFLLPAELASDECDEIQLQIMSRETIGADTFVGVAVLDLHQLRGLVAKKLEDAIDGQERHEVCLWVKYAGRRQGSIDLELRVRRPHQNSTGAQDRTKFNTLKEAAAATFNRGKVVTSKPASWKEREVVECTMTILSTHGLRDPNAIAQPITELKDVANYMNMIHALLFMLLYLVIGAYKLPWQLQLQDHSYNQTSIARATVSCPSHCVLLACVAGGLLHAGCVFYSLVPCALGTDEDDKCTIASFTDALYFSMVTLTTVGYGDMGPSSPV